MTQLAQRLGFDLTDPLAGDREALADLFEGARPSPTPKRILMTFSSRGVSVLSTDSVCSLRFKLMHRFGRRHHLAILDEIAQMRILLADRRFERDRLCAI
jgi:hypothetical protein